MNLVIAFVLVAVLAYQWFSQEVIIKLLGPWNLNFHRDEWPAFYWSTMVLECGLAILFFYWSFS